MKPAPFKYDDPPTLDEALSLLAELENSKILAGGQSLMPMLNFRYLQPDHLIDLNKIAELAGAEVKGQALAYRRDDAAMRTLERSPIVAQVCPMLPTVLAHVGHRQTRNRGTIGGSLCHLDPSAELVNCVSAHDGARLVASGARRGIRELAFSEFAQGYMAHCLEVDEILLRVVLPFWSSRHGYSFMEVAPRKGDFALAAVGVMIEIDGPSDIISRASISVSGASPIPTRPMTAEQLLIGERASMDLFRAVADSVVIEDPLSDSYTTSDYRCHLVRVLTRRVLAAPQPTKPPRGGQMSGETHPCRPRQCAGISQGSRNPADARRFPAPRAFVDWHACGLRAWRLRRLHRAPGRSERPILPHARVRASAWPVGGNRRRLVCLAGSRAQFFCNRPSGSSTVCSADSARRAS